MQHSQNPFVKETTNSVMKAFQKTTTRLAIQSHNRRDPLTAHFRPAMLQLQVACWPRGKQDAPSRHPQSYCRICARVSEFGASAAKWTNKTNCCAHAVHGK